MNNTQQAKISFESIFQYLLMYVILLFHGSALFRLYENQFYISVLIVAGLYLLFHPRLLFHKVMYFVYVIFFLLMVNVVLNTLSLNSAFNVLSRFLLAFVAYQVNPKMAASRFLKIITFFAACSLIGFLIIIIDPNIITKFALHIDLPDKTFYGAFFFTFVDTQRNNGLASEPGFFQIYLNSALGILLFRKDLYISEKKKKKYFVILLVALITAQSTTGYIILASILVLYLLSRTENKKLKGWVLFSVIVLAAGAVVIILSRSTNSFLYYNFINKVSSNGQLDLTVSSGNSRIQSMIADMRVAFLYPLGSGFVTYQEIWRSMLSQYIPDTSSCSGITKAFATYGFPVTITILLFYLYNGLKNKVNWNAFFAFLIVFILSSFASPLITYPSIILLFMLEKSGEVKPAESTH